MTKFLLIFILFIPGEGKYSDQIGAFDTPEACRVARTEVLKLIRPVSGVHYVLECFKTKPTDGSDA